MTDGWLLVFLLFAQEGLCQLWVDQFLDGAWVDIQTFRSGPVSSALGVNQRAIGGDEFLTAQFSLLNVL